ncbi:tRNA modification GTPase trmE [Microdochium trichocladiopsis]|uniref:tRNA modification GTPase trmE n=1 Tax=Microdochium trichocladiopsis TaxID=1682393 RepID=A0A9P9BUY8_9PEZI|nr:tRNA modification GTPase trmE [Microdochium trichocladiopsis]KAH7032772.1 tRNA modification GTPase trmE [Microdochium trichocladiopsis]
MHRALCRRLCSRFSYSQIGAVNAQSRPLLQPTFLPHNRCLSRCNAPISKRQYVSGPDKDTHVQPSKHGDTIYALSTAAGKAGIAVIRVSGPACRQIYHALCPDKVFPKPRYAAVRTLYQPGSLELEVLDSEALVLYFPSPRTVTGEDVLELHIHGGSATVKAVLAAISTCNSAPRRGSGNDTQILHGDIRYAEPGEFTRRAFLNDRLDLAQVEALSETLSAETEQQRRAAVRGNSGALGRTYDGWRLQLLQARAEMEALIDFSEDQHFDESPAALAANVTAQVRQMLASIDMHEQAGQRGELLRSGIKIALLGPPNVGKSSLMNQLVGREASIVSGESGTTRDIIEANLDIRGYLCTFADTAGFRSARSLSALNTPIGAVEEEGIRRARAKALDSDVIIVLASVEPVLGTESAAATATYEIQYDRETLALAAQCGQCLVVVNKRDSVSQEHLDELVSRFQQDVLSQIPGLESSTPLLISCNEAISSQVSPTSVATTRDTSSRTHNLPDPGGITSLADTLVSSFSSMTSLPKDLQDLHGVTERQRQLLKQCRTHLLDYLNNVDGTPAAQATGDDIDITMAAEQLRYAANCLGRITGRGEAGDVEEILGVIFEKFCVGK